MKIKKILQRSTATKDRIIEAMELSNKKQIDISRDTGIAKGTVSNYINGRYEPKPEAVAKLAKSLGVSEMWLMGYDVPMRKAKFDNAYEENPYLLDISDDMDTLEVDDQIYARNWMREFAKSPEKMKTSPAEPELSEGERMLLDLFRRVPEDQQELVLQMIRAALSTQK